MDSWTIPATSRPYAPSPRTKKKALHQVHSFNEQVQEEISKGWIGPAQDHPPSIPFQVRPGSLEPKTDGSSRLVWNASWPAPGSIRSAVKIGDEWSPIAPNAATILPASLELEWSAIESNNEILSIMADGARAAEVPILGRTFDFTKWFRQLAMATQDLWKCTVHVAGGFREDLRMQMGRRSSAHSGQRTTTLLIALLQRAAAREQWGIPRSTDTASMTAARRLKTWLEDRTSRLKASRQSGNASYQGDSCLLRFSSFQDDITAIALGWQAAHDATEGVTRILQERYGVPMSAKEQASKDFSQAFTSIGASYELGNVDNIVFGPREEKIDKYEAMLSALRTAYPLIALQEMQRFAGVHTFMARFLPHGEFFCNSAYCCLRASVHTTKNMRPVSKALLQDAATVLDMLRRNRIAPLIANPVFDHPGHQGFAADASGSAEAGASGWGVHILGGISSGVWSREIKHALAQNMLSISPLELLAAAIALQVAAKTQSLRPGCRQIIMRSDSESACTVANAMRADSAPMLAALRIFKEVQDAANCAIRLQYIKSAENGTADDLSRGLQEEALSKASCSATHYCLVCLISHYLRSVHNTTVYTVPNFTANI